MPRMELGVFCMQIVCVCSTSKLQSYLCVSGTRVQATTEGPILKVWRTTQCQHTASTYHQLKMSQMCHICTLAHLQNHGRRTCQHWASTSQPWVSVLSGRLAGAPAVPANSYFQGRAGDDGLGWRLDLTLCLLPDPMPCFSPGNLTQHCSSLHWPNNWHLLK